MKSLKLALVIFTLLFVVPFSFATGVGSCFPAGTKVTMADGSHKNIEDVAVGEVVLSYNMDTRQAEPATVLELESPVREGYYKLNEDLLRVTNEHPIYVVKVDGREGWASIDPAFTALDSNLEVMQLEIGDFIFTYDEGLVELKTMEYVEGELQTYNLKEVSGHHTFFADDVLVHNKAGGGGGSCFPAGTQVSLPDGSTVNIEDVKVGDVVLSYNMETGQNEPATVLELESPVREGYYNLNNGLLRVTNEHPIYVKKQDGTEGWASIDPAFTAIDSTLEVMQLEIGDFIQTLNGFVQLETMDYIEGELTTYNLKSVSGHHTFYADSVLVHNKDHFSNCPPGTQYTCGGPNGGHCRCEQVCSTSTHSCGVCGTKTYNTCNGWSACSDPCANECGNGVVEHGEACDDGNTDAGDGCSATCEIEQCYHDSDCDDGLYCNGQEYCDHDTYTCKTGTPVVCDDGYFCNGEETCNEDTDSCDDGSEPCGPHESCDETKDTCERIPYCGDGIVDHGEQCDDGNNNAGDGCSATCKVEECYLDIHCDDALYCNGFEYCDHSTYTCKSGAPVVCDDGYFCNGYETCNEYTDSCDTTGDACTHPEVCDEYNDVCTYTPECGNGILDYGEACDDGNTNAGDGCSAYCEIEECYHDSDCSDGLYCNGQEYCDHSDYTCKSGAPIQCNDGAFCNGVETCNEYTDSCDAGHPVICDDGYFCNGEETCNEHTDSCDSGSDPCPHGTSCDETYDVCEHIPYCGDGILDYGEACDDGNNNPADGCSATCEIEECYHDSHCDNGLYCDGQEYCDMTTYTCKAGTPIYCDDGYFCNGLETCNEHTDSCDTGSAPCHYNESCDEVHDVCTKIPLCGDGILDYGETCDDGNTNPGDGCSAVCQQEECHVDADCQDGLFCNGYEICDQTTYTCKPGSPVICPIGQVCDESQDVCAFNDVFDAEIDADPTKGKAPLDVKVKADIFHGVGPFIVEWDFDNDGIIDLVDDHIVTLMFEEEGLYPLFLRVTSADGRVATDTEVIIVGDKSVVREQVHVNGIHFDKEYYKPGDYVHAFINFENQGYDEMRGTRVKAMMPELGIRSNTLKASVIEDRDQSSKMLTLELPRWVEPGDHWVMFVIDIDGDRRIKYRPITVI